MHKRSIMRPSGILAAVSRDCPQIGGLPQFWGPSVEIYGGGIIRNGSLNATSNFYNNLLNTKRRMLLDLHIYEYELNPFVIIIMVLNDIAQELLTIMLQGYWYLCACSSDNFRAPVLSW